jgi:hypothetical protein
MPTAGIAPNSSLVAHIRRLSAAGSALYIRIGASDISRLGLTHGQAIEMDLGRVRISGIVKTSGSSPWLAPVPGSSNAAMTAILRGADLEHGMDVSVSIRSLGSAPEAVKLVNAAPARVVVRTVDRLQGPWIPLRIDPEDAVQHVRDYNADYYRGRRNVDLDREAYERFRNGLSNNLQDLTDQIAFVGEQYGGAQERFLPHDIRTEASLIANNLHRDFGQWVGVAENVKPLIADVPDESTLEILLSPFVVTKQWGVWASKTLHFVHPHAFPILDSNAKKPMGLRNLGSSSRDYHRFSVCFCDVLLANAEALAAARAVDAGESPTDLKLLDKILFQTGKRMN